MMFGSVAHSSSVVGSRIGPYLIERKLGAGGMAEVFLAKKCGPYGFEKRVAIKRMQPALTDEPSLVRMFCEEARLLAAVAHPNIAQILDFAEEGGAHYMVLEYVDGPSCAALLRAVHNAGARVPAAPALYIAREVLRALAFAHEARGDDGVPLGIIHRDVSPSNVLFSMAGSVKLIDFGITRSALGARTTHPGELKGKIRYMAPEQILGQEIDPRADLFVVGIVLAELLMGRSLFAGKTDLEILTRVTRGDLSRLWNADLTPDLTGLLSVALSMDPTRRFSTAREFARAVDATALARGITLEEDSLVRYIGAMSGSPRPPSTRASNPTAYALPPGRRPPPPPSARRQAPAPSRH